jgi:hypothetical protein
MSMMLTREDLARMCPRPSSASKAVVWDDYVEALLAPE